MADPGSPGEMGIYNPFPAFTEWKLSQFDTTDFERYTKLLADAKSSATPDALTKAMMTAARYAAVDTGAIEGLYTVDRGFTRTVATQATAWEVVMESRGQHVRPAFEDALRGTSTSSTPQRVLSR